MEHKGWLFMAGGYNSSAKKVSTVGCVDVSTGELVALPSLPHKCTSAALVVLGDKLVLFGGRTSEGIWLNDLFTLDLSQ